MTTFEVISNIFHVAPLKYLIIELLILYILCVSLVAHSIHFVFCFFFHIKEFVAKLIWLFLNFIFFRSNLVVPFYHERFTTELHNNDAFVAPLK